MFVIHTGSGAWQGLDVHTGFPDVGASVGLFSIQILVDVQGVKNNVAPANTDGGPEVS